MKACARLSLWTANRPGVTRTLRWDELDLDAGLWTIRKGREGMKRGYFHLTPLPTQAIAMLRDLRRVTGNFVQPRIAPVLRFRWRLALARPPVMAG